MYKDVAGLPTIGVGHLLTQDVLSSGKILIHDKIARYADGLTKKQVIQLLAQDVDMDGCRPQGARYLCNEPKGNQFLDGKENTLFKNKGFFAK